MGSYQEAKAILDKIKLSAYDFHGDESVLIRHSEGTQLFFRNAFLKEWKNWIFVFTEHHRYFLYDKTDLDSFHYFKEKEIESIKDTGKDNCSKCKKEFLIEELKYYDSSKGLCEKCYDI